MKKLLCVLLCLILLVGCMPTAMALYQNEFYIDSEGGSDDNSGTSPNDPWRTTANLQGVALRAGDGIYFKAGGVYPTDCITLRCSGTRKQPILVTSYGKGEKPLLTTTEAHDLLHLIDSSYVTVSNLEMTAHNGGGIWINTEEKNCDHITLDHLTIHDIQNHRVHSRDDSTQTATENRACIQVKGTFSHNPYRVNYLTISNCELYDCGNGISIWGAWDLDQDPFSGTLEELDFYYNKGVLVRNCYMHDMNAEALVMGECEESLVTDCRAIDCCLGDGMGDDGNLEFCTAAMWFWGSRTSTMQYCEIAGQKNLGDGMSCDFDSRSNYCTYQYIYSHDNIRFVRPCPDISGQKGNTIRYCLSVNDNKGDNRLAASEPETDFRFYNNTIINSAGFVMVGNKNALVANNIITGDLTTTFYLSKKVKNEETGKAQVLKFDGVFTNNCLYGACIPSVSRNTIVKNPRFVGKDYSDPESFRLAEDSPLLHAGIPIDDSGEWDFYGNPIQNSNAVGCYAGSGEAGKGLRRPFDYLYRLLNTALGSVYQFVYEIINRNFVF